jgi:hypothetical protein
MTRKRKNVSGKDEEVEIIPKRQHQNDNQDRFPTELIHYLRQMAREVPEDGENLA